MRGWRSRLSRVMFAALLGVTATYVVAWRCCIVAAEQSRRGAISAVIGRFDATDRYGAWWMAYAPSDAGDPGTSRLECVPGCELLTLYELPKRPGAIACVRMTKAGWPLYAIEGNEFRIPTHPGWRIERHGCMGLAILWPFGVESIPIRPILPGFIVDSTMFGAIAWLLLTIPGAAVRLIRRRRGQCPACGYPRGSSPICTECGAAFAKNPKIARS